MPGESDNNERILYTSESVGEGHPGKYQKYFLLEIFKYFKYFVKNIPLFATLSTRKSSMTRCQRLIHPLLHQRNQFGENNFVT